MHHNQHDNFHPMQEPRMDMDPRMHHDTFEPPPPHERFNRRDRRGADGFMDEDRRMIEDFDNRGPMNRGLGPDFFPPREGFGPPPPPRGPMMRGADGFQPPPLRGGPRGPGPRMFHPRGPLLRGPRPSGIVLKRH